MSTPPKPTPKSEKYEFKVLSESLGDVKREVHRLKAPDPTKIQNFEFPKMRTPGSGNYKAVRDRVGGITAVDRELGKGEETARRFSFHPLLKKTLHIQDEEARLIEKEVNAKIESMSSKAQQDGFAKGVEEGKKQGHEEAVLQFKNDSKSLMDRFESLVGEFEGTKESIFKTNERFIQEMIFRIAKMIALKEIKQDPQYVLRLAAEIIEKVGVKENISIKMHPSDEEQVSKVREGLISKFGELRNLTIETSPQVRLGGCVIETSLNLIDASIETQLENIHRAVTGENSGTTNSNT